jgi:putative transposase
MGLCWLILLLKGRNSMARQQRFWYKGATYHIYARGNRKEVIFYDDSDYLMYLSILEEVRATYPFILHSYCIMTNHLHLQIETIDHHIKIIMKEIHSRYAIYLNKKLQVVGHVFQGRYGSEIIENIDYFLETSRYIHRNPLEANMVTSLEEYPWSSYCGYTTHSENPHVCTKRTLSYFSEPVKENYKRLVECGDKEVIQWLPKLPV